MSPGKPLLAHLSATARDSTSRRRIDASRRRSPVAIAPQPFGAIRHDALGRAARRRRAHVRDEVRDREVDSRGRRRSRSGSGSRTCARATPSSLNAHRSSSDPPPRATISTSQSARAAASLMRLRDLARRGLALHGRPGRSAPATAGKRARSTCRMSRMAAPVGEVIDADAAAAAAAAAACGARRTVPRRRSFCFSSSNRAAQRAFAGFLEVLDDDLEFAARPRRGSTRPRASTCMPSRTGKRTQRGSAGGTWRSAPGPPRPSARNTSGPEAGRDRFEISPSSHTGAEAPLEQQPRLPVEAADR